MRRVSGLILSLLIVIPFAVGLTQGKSKGKGRSQGTVEKSAKGRSAQVRQVKGASKSRAPVIDEFGGEVERSRIRPFASAKHGQRVARAAVA
ncbi:MAG: hypothetical protein ACRENU_04090, partial [Gemmatimonadaceae bacterium]